MPREILVDWNTDGPGGTTVMYFPISGTLADQRSALAAFLASADLGCANSTTWTIAQSGRELDDATGTLTGAWSSGVAHTGTGGSSATQTADATQALVRWNTGTVVAGRFLKGRTFIPGMAADAFDNGNLVSGLITTINNACTTFLASAGPPVIWHRPVQSAGGSVAVVNTGSVWPELAVLRRRRG